MHAGRELTWYCRHDLSYLPSGVFLQFRIEMLTEKRLTCSRYKIVVFPALSSPSMSIRTSLSFPQLANDVSEEKMDDIVTPIMELYVQIIDGYAAKVILRNGWQSRAKTRCHLGAECKIALR